MRSVNCRRALVLSSALAGMVSVAGLGSARAQPEPVYQFDIPAESLAQALKDFAVASAQQIVFSAQDLDDRGAPALLGRYTREQALAILLSGMDLHVETSAAGVLMVRAGQPQATAGARPASPPPQTQTPQTPQTPQPQLETVVITGTNIRGLDTPIVPPMTFDREQIELDGYSDIDDFVRSIPQNFGGGDLGSSPDGAVGPGRNGANNIEGGTGVNLRGLGATSTLTLVDGHRVATSAFGGFVDISQIPIMALDHVDIVLDGSSALYGSDAVGGVANFVLRKSFDGAESDLQYGVPTDGGLQEYTAGQLLGKTWDTGGALIALQYHDRGSLPSSDRSFTDTAPQPTNVLNHFLKDSLVFNGHQMLASDLELRADAFVTRDSTGLLLTQTTLVPDYTSDQHTSSGANNFSAGLSYDALASWVIDGTMSYSRQMTGYEFSESPTALLGVENNYDDTIRSYDLNASGTLLKLPGGNVMLAAGVSDRTEGAGISNPAFQTPFRGFNRDALAEYAELYAPLVPHASSIPLLSALDLSAAVRHDHYSDFGGTTNPKLAVKWNPFTDLDVKSTWGRSFRAPSAGEDLLQDLGTGAYIYNYPVSNATGTGVQPIFIEQAYNKPLLPERASTSTFGLDYTPSFLPGAKLTADYYDINYRNRIIQPPADADILEHPDIYGSLLTPLASDAAAQAYLTAFEAQPGDTFIDLLGTGATGVRAVYNLSLQNAAVSRQAGFDVLAQYALALGASKLDFRVNIAVIDHIETQFSSTSVPLEEVNTYSNPPKFRMRDELSWSRPEWTVMAAVNYTNAYIDTTAIPYGTVGAYTTVDLNLRYAPAALHGFSATLSVLNLLNTDPPYVAGGVGLEGIHYDVGNASPLGRFVSLALRQFW